MADREVYALKHPITFGSETITTLAFRPPKAGDFRAMPVDKQTIGDILNAAGRLCGQPAVVMDELQGEDFQEVASRVATFMGSSPGTGIAPSR